MTLDKLESVRRRLEMKVEFLSNSIAEVETRLSDLNTQMDDAVRNLQRVNDDIIREKKQ